MVLLQETSKHYGKSNSIIYRADKLGIHIPHDITLQNIKIEIRNLRRQVLEIHKSSKEKRQEAIKDTSNLKEDLEDHQQAKALRQMAKCERKQEVYAHFNYIRNLESRGGSINWF